MNRIDISGMKFGKLYVIEMIFGEVVNGKKRSQCFCLCDCGNYIITTTDRVRSGSKKSCGCDTIKRRILSNRKDLTGMKFHRLTVIGMDWSVRPSRAICICDCGNNAVVIGTGLTSGKTGSCGCFQRDRASFSNTKNWDGVVSDYGVSFVSSSRIDANGRWLWFCKCGLCGCCFEALPAKVMNGHITSCGCRKRSSREQLISSILTNLEVSFLEQFRIEECKDKCILSFDFAVFGCDGLDFLIEYDGRQHYMSVPHFGGEKSFNDRKRKDKIKSDYCKDNKIRLLRLPYSLTDEEIYKNIKHYLS